MDPPTKRRKITFDSLKDLVKDRKNDELKSILQKNSQLNLVDNHGTTLLHLAAKHNNIDLIHFLLELNHNIDARNSSGATPLLVAAKNHSFDALKILLNANANIFATNSAEVTVLDILLSEKTIVTSEIFDCFLQAMKRSNANVDKMADLFMNAHCKLEIVMSLCDARVTEAVLKRMVTIDPVQSQSAFYFAMKSIDMENLRALLNCGPDTDARLMLFFGSLLEMVQEINVDLESFEMFITAMIDWDIISRDKLDYFHNMLINGSQNVVQLLLQCEVDVYVKSKFDVDLIPAVFGNKNIDVIALMRNRRFNVNAQGFRGLSALHFALRNRAPLIIQFLIDRGADLEIRDNLGKTPLLDCHAWSGQCFGQLLLFHGANIQAVDYDNVGVYDITNAKSISAIVIPHLALLKMQNTVLEQKFRFLINSEDFIQNYQLCCQDLRNLKRCVLADSLTLFDVLTNRVKRISDVLRAVDFTGSVAYYCFSNQIIPYYTAMLKTKLHRAMIVYLAMRNMALIVSGYTKFPIDHDHLVVERIFSFLSYYDLCFLL